MGQRLTIAQAADRLGISLDAMRARVKRGTVETEREGGRVYVVLDDDQDATRSGESNALTSQLRDEVAYLREENRRKDHIIAGLVERIPALEGPADSPPDATTAPERGEAEGDRGSVPPDPQAAPQRPWWRRILGG